MAIFSGTALVWVTLFLAGLWAESLFLKLGIGLALGLSTGTLFVVGHDAAHGSLTPNATLNRVLAMLAFLPSLHPVCTWETGHNKLHHSWTGVKGRDPAYAPLSPDEFCALSQPQQALHRFYHTLWGSGFYYLVDIWWRCQIRCQAPGYTGFCRHTALLDYGAVFLFCGVEVALIGAFSSPQTILLNVGALLLLPFLVWNYVMAFVTIQHHTHPSIPWHSDCDGWDFYEAQVKGTVHVEAPKLIDWAFGNIFHHTAHHVDRAIPLYEVHRAQEELERKCAADVMRVRMSPRHFREILGCCQLFDFEASRWMKFEEARLSKPEFSFK